jgi:AraC-like DNA-binding protein
VARLNLTASFYGGPGYSLYHAMGSQSRVPLAPHFHDEYLICAQIRGDEKCHVAGKLYEFRAGDVALINPLQVHTGNTQGEDVEYISLYVDRQLVQRLAEELGAPDSSPEFTVVKSASQEALIEEMCRLLELVQHSERALLFPTPAAEEDPEIEIPLRHVAPAREPSAPQPVVGSESSSGLIDGLAIESAVGRVVIHAFEEFSNLRTPMLRSTNRVPHRKIARALDYMRGLGPGVPADAVALDRLSEIAELSKYHFLRQFSQIVGMTPGAYLRTLRLCQAARMLRTTVTPILDIALAVGFADHPSFSRAFARHMGLTPSEYRRLGPL